MQVQPAEPHVRQPHPRVARDTAVRYISESIEERNQRRTSAPVARRRKTPQITLSQAESKLLVEAGASHSDPPPTTGRSSWTHVVQTQHSKTNATTTLTSFNDNQADPPRASLMCHVRGAQTTKIYIAIRQMNKTEGARRRQSGGRRPRGPSLSRASEGVGHLLLRSHELMHKKLENDLRAHRPLSFARLRLSSSPSDQQPDEGVAAG